MQPQVRIMGCSSGPLGLGLPQGVLQRLQVCRLDGRSSAWTNCRLQWVVHACDYRGGIHAGDGV